MSNKTNRPILIETMAQHGLTANDVARALGRAPNSVYHWRQRGGEDIPDHLLELLQLKIQLGHVGSGNDGAK